MVKITHEVRDAIHIFIRFSLKERSIIDSRPLQRLRHIHQLALSYLVYPGATHKRFEHSLGVMDLAARVFDVVTKEKPAAHGFPDSVRAIVDEPETLRYWRTALRMAALCHDVGHLPFSHAAESELLPAGWSHERLTKEFILSNEMKTLFDEMTPPLRAADVAKLAVGPRKAPELEFSTWETILSEIIIGDAFGVDRIDYLLRDSLHTGVGYGRFDHHRLIDTLRILSPPPQGEEEAEKDQPVLGIEAGGIHSAEALLWARYFMYSQVYFHPVRCIYNIHLRDFLLEWLSNRTFPTDPEEMLRITDNEVLAAICKAAGDPNKEGHDPARRIIKRHHFKLIYERNPNDLRVNPQSGDAVFCAACDEFGGGRVRREKYMPSSQVFDFPVLAFDNRIASSASVSVTLEKIPVVAVDYVFVDPEIRDDAKKWLDKNRMDIIQPRGEEE